TNLNQVAIQFNRPVSVERGDLHVRGMNVADYGFSAFRYDPATRTAVWTLDRSVGADKLLLQLDGVELAGGPGGGVAPYRSRIDVLPGDVTRDGSVLANDYSEVKQRFFKSATDGSSSLPAGYTVYHDV